MRAHIWELCMKTPKVWKYLHKCPHQEFPLCNQYAHKSTDTHMHAAMHKHTPNISIDFCWMKQNVAQKQTFSVFAIERKNQWLSEREGTWCCN
jgi:hypothetical protein